MSERQQRALSIEPIEYPKNLNKRTLVYSAMTVEQIFEEPQWDSLRNNKYDLEIASLSKNSNYFFCIEILNEMMHIKLKRLDFFLGQEILILSY